jgi:hypothetical protein
VAKFTDSEKALVEHYVYATVTAGVILWQRGGVANHNLKHVAFAALYGVIGPVLAKMNPKGIVAKLTKKEHLSAPEAAVATDVVTTAIADASKALATAAK